MMRAPGPLQPSPLEIGFYGELDLYGGGVGTALEQLPDLINELKLFLLVKDVVIFSPGSMLEHPLALPACQALAPFVRSGRLTTTASPRVPHPGALLEARAQQYLHTLGSPQHPQLQAHRRTTTRRRSQVQSLVDHWHELLPSQWTLTRNVKTQVEHFAQGLLEFTTQDPAPSPAMMALRGYVEQSLSTSTPFDRTQTLKGIMTVRGHTPRWELARMVFATQSQFFRFGVGAHGRCKLYPGAFAQLVERLALRGPLPPLPPIDWSAAPACVRTRLDALGFQVDQLLALPAERLLEVVSSPQWEPIRRALRGAAVPSQLVGELHALSDEAPHVLEAIARIDPSCLPPLHAPWQLAARASLGILPAAHEEGPVLDLNTHQIRPPGLDARPVSLSQLELLTALANSEAGVAVDDLEQMFLDLDRLPTGLGAPLPAWRSKASTHGLNQARAGRVRTQISRLNRELGAFGLRVSAKDGRYRLLDTHARPGHLVLSGLLLSLLDRPEAPAPATGLSPLQTTLWDTLAAHAPQPVTVNQVAAALGKPQDDRGKKQTVEALGRLEQKLRARSVPWSVQRIRRGAYALIPRT